jgi:hypothetical protein
MILPRLSLLLVLASGLSLAIAVRADEPAAIAAAGAEVRDALTSTCLHCHSAERRKGKLDLSRRERALKGDENGPALVPGHPEESLLYQRIKAGEMPPQKPLGPEQIAAFKRWIEGGAPYAVEPLAARSNRAGADWWSLRKIERPNPPHVANPTRNPIDAFVLAQLEANHLTPAPQADRRTLIRRATFDLTGLPPTPAEVDAFEGDLSPLAYEQLIDRLLASPRYGEHWARHWLDVVRFGESHGYETNLLRPNAWPYRDYVIGAFNSDKPYNQFVVEQLAGDVVGGGDVLVQAATGFLVGGAHDVVGNQTPEGMRQQRMDDLDDMIAATCSTFLGLTVHCARCNDHKFDPITQRDYYSLQAIVAGVQHAERDITPVDGPERGQKVARLEKELADPGKSLDASEPLADVRGSAPRRAAVNARRNVERFAPVQARWVRFSIAATNDGIEPCIDELEILSAEAKPRNLALASAGARATASSVYPNSDIHRLEHLNDGRYGNSRSWISNEPGKGWVQIELKGNIPIDEIVWGRDREERFKDRLATQYKIEVAERPGEWRLVASSSDRRPFIAVSTSQSPATEGLSTRNGLLERRRDLQSKLALLREGNKIYAGTFSQPGPTHVLLRGDPMRDGEAVVPGGLSAVGPRLALDAASLERDRRLALARWITNPDNPLPARVIVNRLWHYHFGQGIVATPSDFGFNGERPSHPELLDWLASELKANGWRLKPIQRTILLSATYRQSGKGDEKALACDRGNRLLWHVPPRRLEAEELRDAILATGGQLVSRMGGEGYSLWEKNTNYVVVFKPKSMLERPEFRRMIYQFKPRTQQDPTFGIFDCPDAALARPRRTVSITALQALNLFNSSFMLQQAETFSERLAREAGPDPLRQVDYAFRLALGRMPSPKESAAATEFLRTHGASALCRALYNANEFLYVD